MNKKINLMVVLDKEGHHTVNIAPSDCDNLEQAQEFLTGTGCDDKVVDFISIEETEPDDLAFGILEQLLGSDSTRDAIEMILSIIFLRGLCIPHDKAAGLD